MLVFKAEIEIISEAPENEEMKQIFMQNAEDVIQQGLEKMTVPDWKVNIIDIEERKE